MKTHRFLKLQQASIIIAVAAAVLAASANLVNLTAKGVTQAWLGHNAQSYTFSFDDQLAQAFTL